MIFQDTSHLDYTTVYQFEPHSSEDNIAQYYLIKCPADTRKPKEAVCSIHLNQAFYAKNPKEYFAIEKTSDIATALWAYEKHKGIEVVPENDWMKRWLSGKHRVLKIEIDNHIARFSYHSGGCYHEIWYDIVGNNEALKFNKTSSGFCI